ncbi:MAG: Stk1 family PASTA domain-containing Ser/Thr kinase, partial [Actinomycetota bacterium]|nr:Stk1 family PASTA domain-containing Ser/Thr kinase [Actinomycetota bacterium]
MERQGPAHDGNLVGTLLDGRYRVGPVLARGGMSTVYRGTDMRLERPVAIKVMAPRFAADPTFLQRFEREARAAARLDHPGVVAVHDQGVDLTGNHAFLVMELVEGATLRDLMRQHGKLPVPLAIAVTEMVLSALAAAHREGLVHRDIKPENVLIGPGGVVKVADFGLVRAAAEASSTGDVILGTVAYLSPEQVATGTADARSDVYATGVLLFEMLTAAPPYSGETALSVAYRHVNDDMPAPSAAGAEVPAALDDLVVQATRRDPAVRPPDASAFLRSLQAVRTGLGIDPVTVPLPTSAWSMAAAGPPTTMAGLPTDHGPRGTRALSRVDELTGGPDVGDGAAAGPVSGPPPGSRPRKQLPPDDPYLRERARNRRAFIAWIVIVLMLASAIGVSAWWLGSGRWTVVPNLAGARAGTVQATLAAADLKSNLTEDHHDTVPGGAVISTDPGPGQRAVRGSDVTVVISLGRPVVPELAVGIAVQEAEDALREADLSPRRDPTAEEFHDTVPKGTVIGLRPAEGTTLTVGAPVTLVISKGVAPATVPDVRGLPEADAVSRLTRAGLTVQVRRQFDGEMPGGRAIGTDPRSGTSTTRGTRVVLLVSTASVVPEVVGLSVAEAQQVLANAGLNSTVRQSLGGLGGIPFLGGLSDQVISQSPAAGQPVRPGV